VTVAETEFRGGYRIRSDELPVSQEHQRLLWDAHENAVVAVARTTRKKEETACGEKKESVGVHRVGRLVSSQD